MRRPSDFKRLTRKMDLWMALHGLAENPELSPKIYCADECPFDEECIRKKFKEVYWSKKYKCCIKWIADGKLVKQIEKDYLTRGK